MTEAVNSNGKRGASPWRMLGWGAAALLLVLPAVAMQFNTGVNWTAGDFILVALVLGLVGVTLELTVRASKDWAYRGGAGAAVAASFLIVWATGALGMIGNEDNPYNLLFFGVIGLALVGSVLARFRAAPMAAAMIVAGVAHIGVALGGLTTDLRGAIFSAGLGLIWLGSAALFRMAARTAAAAGEGARR